MSYDDLIKKIDLSIRSLCQIKRRVVLGAKMDLQGGQGQQYPLILDEIWNRFQEMFKDGLLKQLQAKVKQIVDEHQLSKSTQQQEQDIQQIIDEQEYQPEDFQRWKAFMKHVRSTQSEYTAYGEDLTHLRQKYLNFSNINEDQNNQSLNKSLNSHYQNSQNYQLQTQTVQVSIQTEQLDIAFYESSYSQKRSGIEKEMNSSNLKLSKSFIPSIQYSPSPVVAYKQFQNFSPQSQIKEKLPFLYTTNQSSLNENFHHFALNSVNTLLYVLKNMEYMLPIGYLTQILKSLMDCRTFIKNRQHLEERQFEFIQKVYKKVVKKMKTFRKQVKKDYQESKFIDINQIIAVKIT